MKIRRCYLLLTTLSIYMGLFQSQLIADNYIRNRAPLIETPFIQLPVGSVKAEGWLLKQLILQKEGLTGHAEELYSGANDLGTGSDWLGGIGDSWERVPYYTKGLVALAYVLDDAELKAKAQKWLDWTLNNQRRNGYIGPLNNNDWWARMPMLYAIRDYYEATNDERVIPFFTKYFQYQNNTIDSQKLSSWGKSRAGDNIDIVLWLYNRTGDVFLLELADKLKDQSYDWTNIYTYNKFNYFGKDFQPKHNVNIPQAMKMPAIYYQLSKSVADRDAYFHGKNHLMCDHGQPCGMQSGNEMLAGKSSLTGLELCSVVEQMQTSETAQMILGDPSIGDQLEKVAFNALPGGLTNDIKALQYYQQTNQVISKFGYYGFGQNYDNGNMPSPYSGYGCCRFDFHMGWPYFVKTMWAATAEDGLAAMAYGPCSVTAKVGNGVEVTVDESTDYPFDEQLIFTMSVSNPVSFPLKLRIPAWCKTPQLWVNDVIQDEVIPGTFHTIDRTWQNDDKVTLLLPMTIQIHEEVNNAVSIQRGPMVYSLLIEEDWAIRNDYGNGFHESEVLPTTPWNYALLIDKDNPDESIQINKKSMPENPFEAAVTPVTLTLKAKKIPTWSYAFNERIATDPPYGPLESSEKIEQVTLIPYGSGTLRATVLPVIGTNKLAETSFEEDFSTGQQGWVQYGGSFFIDNGEYNATNIEGGNLGSKSVVPATQFDDFIFDARIMVKSEGDAGVIFRASRLSFGADEYNGYYFGISSSAKRIELGKADGMWTSLKTANMDISSNQWYQIRIEAVGEAIKIYVNDMTTPKLEYSDTSFTTGCIGVRAYRAQASWDDIHVNALSTGLKEKKIAGVLKVFPNPVLSSMTVLSPLKGKITVFNSSGKQVYASFIPLGTSNLNTESYPSGIYLIKLTTIAGTYSTCFVKREIS